MELVKRINKYLIDTYGLALDNTPKFRLVWSDDLFETRKGLFERYSGPIYLGSFDGIQKAPKYSYVKERWVLEVYTKAYPEVFGPSIRHREDTVMDSDGYEPLRVFQTRKKEYLPPNQEVCKIICDAFSELINRPVGRRLTEAQALSTEIAEIDLETARFFEMLNGDDSTLIHQFRDKEAVILPGKET